jgi:TPR repeat protein
VQRFPRFFSALPISLVTWIFFSASLLAQDSAPQLVSRTAGGVQWKNIKELKAAAASGNPEACAQLGEVLLRGDSAPKDGAQAIALLEKAARAGVASAAFRVGMLLDDGYEVPQDRTRAVGYFRAAAAGNFPLAYHNVGAAYAGAHGVKLDYVEALGWLILAKKHGVGADSEKAVRDRILKLRHPEWIAAGEKRAGEIERELAAKSPIEFLPPPAPLSFIGSNTNDSSNASAPSSATANGNGVVTLGAVHVSGSPDNTAESAEPANEIKLITPTGRPLRWPSLEELQRAADTGDPAALAALGQVLIEGKSAPVDVARAIPLLERAAKSGNADAAQALADLYTNGAKIRPDATKAFQYNLQAARGGSPQAMYNTGALLSNGLGVTRDFTEALAWLIVAKQHGRDPGAEKRIRDYLAKSAPDQVTAAEKRAAELQREIESTVNASR